MLNKPQLVIDLKSLFDTTIVAANVEAADPDTVRQNFATGLANAIETYVKGIQITIGPSVVVITGPGGGGTNPSPIVIDDTPPNSID